MSDNDDFDFEYDDEMSIDEDERNPENRYYTAKALKEDEILRAEDEFYGLIRDEPQSEWSLRAAKQLLKIKNIKTHEVFAKFMNILINAVGISDAYRDQSFSNVLRRIERDQQSVESITKQAIDMLHAAGNMPRLEVRATLIFARHCIERDDYTGALKSLERLRLPKEPETDWHPALYLEYLALQMKLHASDRFSIEKWYDRASTIQVQMIHPRILGIVREFGGILALHKCQWERGCTILLKSFKSYDEAGMSADRIRVLRLYTLASLLTETGLSPFDLPETKAYQKEPTLSSFKDIVVCALDKRPPSEVYSCIERARSEFPDDREIQELLPLVYNSYEAISLAAFFKPYRRIRLDKVSALLGISERRVTELTKRLVLQGKLGDIRVDELENCVLREVSPELIPPSQRSFPLPLRYSETAREANRREYEQRILGKKPFERDNLAQAEAGTLLKWIINEYSGSSI